MTVENKKNFIINTIYLSMIAITLFLAIKLALGTLFPFFAGFLVATAARSIVKAIKFKKRLHDGFFSAAAVVVIYLIIIGGVLFLGSKIISFLSDWLKEIPYIASTLYSAVDLWEVKFRSFLIEIPDESSEYIASLLRSAIGSSASAITSKIPDFLGSIAGRVPEFLLGLLVAFVSGCFIAYDYSDILRFFNEILPNRFAPAVLRAKEVFLKSVFKAIKGYIILTIITFLEVTVGLLIFGIKNAVAIAAIIAAVDILPIVGSGTILIPWAVYNIFAQNIGLGIGLIVLYVITVVMHNFLEARIVGKGIGIHPLFMLILVFCGFKLFGALGIIVLPLAVMMIFSFFKDGTEEK